MQNVIGARRAAAAGLAAGWALLAAIAAAAAAGDFTILSLSRDPGGPVILEWEPLPGSLGFQVESRDQLAAGPWAPCPPLEQWPVRALRWRDEQPAAARFYRVVALVDPGFARGRVLSLALLDELTPAELTTLFFQNRIPAPVTYGVGVYVIGYETIDSREFRATASGALVLPRGVARALPLVSYQHGTIVKRAEAPSRGAGLEYLLGLALGTDGYVAALPDYLGLGDSPGLHPYLHARSEASAVVDFLRAARAACQTAAVALDGRIFLIGYSQGGHVTMAAHRQIEEEHSGEFTVTAAAPMAGPYDMSGTMVDHMLSDQPMADPYYLPYVLLSYDAVYDLFDSPADIFVEPYASILPPLFDGTHGGAEINAVLPAVPKSILQPAVLAAFLEDPLHPLRLALEDNDLYDWTPLAPVRMYHCAGDRTVPFANSRTAYEAFLADGAQAELIDPSPLADHGGCAPWSLLAAKAWIDSFPE